jgi:hypothetical protein
MMTNKEDSIFDRKISWFTSMRDVEPKNTTLGEFLAKGEEYREHIERLRSCRNADERKYLKSQLPQATISGVFQVSRKADNLTAHSGLICVDIDAKDNPDVNDFEHLKENVLSQIDEVAYAAHSVGGKGYFIILKLAYPGSHAAQFRELKKDFAKYGITIDGACSDVSRLRCLSYDDVPCINEHASLYKGIEEEPKLIVRPFRSFRDGFFDDTDERVYMACMEIKRRHIDMTENYDDWINIGFSLASLGEEGREYFHIVSSQNAKYTERETDRKFDGFLRGHGRIGIGTFFHYCKLFGVL